jgi:hypothetical protein
MSVFIEDRDGVAIRHGNDNAAESSTPSRRSAQHHGGKANPKHLTCQPQ